MGPQTTTTLPPPPSPTCLATPAPRSQNIMTTNVLEVRDSLHPQSQASNGSVSFLFGCNK